MTITLGRRWSQNDDGVLKVYVAAYRISISLVKDLEEISWTS
jgi:hypothetical protein